MDYVCTSVQEERKRGHVRNAFIQPSFSHFFNPDLPRIYIHMYMYIERNSDANGLHGFAGTKEAFPGMSRSIYVIGPKRRISQGMRKAENYRAPHGEYRGEGGVYGREA